MYRYWLVPLRVGSAFCILVMAVTACYEFGNCSSVVWFWPGTKYIHHVAPRCGLCVFMYDLIFLMKWEVFSAFLCLTSHARTTSHTSLHQLSNFWPAIPVCNTHMFNLCGFFHTQHLCIRKQPSSQGKCRWCVQICCRQNAQVLSVLGAIATVGHLLLILLILLVHACNE